MADSRSEDVNAAIVALRAAVVRLGDVLRAQVLTLRTSSTSDTERIGVTMIDAGVSVEIGAMLQRVNNLQSVADVLSARLHAHERAANGRRSADARASDDKK